jgi:thiamine pyrophosphate-dependent acetolactate synthase large subunit-like protein
MDDKERNVTQKQIDESLCVCGHPKKEHQKFVNGGMFIGCSHKNCPCEKYILKWVYFEDLGPENNNKIVMDWIKKEVGDIPEEQIKIHENPNITLEKLKQMLEESFVEGRNEYLIACAKHYDDYVAYLRKMFYGDPDSKDKPIGIINEIEKEEKK